MLKNLILKFDEKFLDGIIQENMRQWRRKIDIKEIDLLCQDKFYVFYDKDISSEMAKLCDKYGSDKGSLTPKSNHYKWLAHSYTDFYSRMYSHCRNSVLKVFECGLGTNNPDIVSSMGVTGKPGASLRMWRDYFPNAKIYGGDIDKNVLFEEEKIKTFYLDQLDPLAIREFWVKVNERNFDLMIDDGLHTFEAGITLFLHSVEFLSPNGIYVIEDVLKNDLVRYKKHFDNSNYLVDYVTMFRPKVGLGDNSLIVIRKGCDGVK